MVKFLKKNRATETILITACFSVCPNFPLLEQVTLNEKLTFYCKYCMKTETSQYSADYRVKCQKSLDLMLKIRLLLNYPSPGDALLAVRLNASTFSMRTIFSSFHPACNPYSHSYPFSSSPFPFLTFRTFDVYLL